MAVKLIRENSDVPNITNKDDARMIRYAYGGQDGYVKGKGAELDYTVNGNVFTINSGVLNLQGWEVEIDTNGWSATFSTADAAKKYVSVYCEVNLSLGGSAKFDIVTALDNYPEVSEGDDLTANSSGIARLVLYQFIAQSGVISEIKKIVNVMLYGAVMTTRPPISSISFQNGQNIRVYHGTYPSSGGAISGANVIQSTSTSGVLISYLPNGSYNSVASVEFVYSRDDMLYYVVGSSGNFLCYSNGRPVVGDKVDVTARVTDVYGNKFMLYWSIEVY